MPASVAAFPASHRHVRRRGMAGRRHAVRAQAVPRGSVARRSRPRSFTVLHRTLGAVALVAALLLAILPVHAHGLGRDRAERIASEAQAVADATEHGATDAAWAFASREVVADPAPMSPAAGAARTAVDGPPVIGWYRLAAAEQGVSEDLLRALHEVESSAAPDGCVANLEGSGALGPFQFKRATFRQYGVDGNHDGERDICSFTDALFSAALYLRALGADGLDDPRTRQALARYGTDPDRVLALARSYRNRAALAR